MLQLKIDKQKKYILIAGGILLFFALCYRLFPVFQGFRDADEETALKERQLAKFQQVVKKRDNLQTRLISLNRTLERMESELLNGETPSLAAVDVQNILNDIAERSGVGIKTVRVLKPEKLDNENYLVVPVQFTISCSIRQIKEIFYRIETFPKYLTVKKGKISVEKRANPGQVQLALTVTGLMKVKQKS